MKKYRWLPRACVVLLIAALLAVSVSATGVGTANDPLVSLSYLQETFLTQIMTGVDELLTRRNAEMTAEMDEALAGFVKEEPPEGSLTNETFAVVTMSKGQTLMGEIGCEVMLRVGTATCVSASNPGLIDQTDGTVLSNGGALVKNHLYMMTIEDRGVKATANTVKVLVRGTYTLK